MTKACEENDTRVTPKYVIIILWQQLLISTALLHEAYIFLLYILMKHAQTGIELAMLQPQLGLVYEMAI